MEPNINLYTPMLIICRHLELKWKETQFDYFSTSDDDYDDDDDGLY